MGKFDFIEEDKRILEQKVRKHQLSKSEYQRLLKNLPEEKGSAEEIQVAPKEKEEETSS